MILKIISKVLVAAAYAFLFWFVFFVINPLCYSIFQQPAFVLTTDYFLSTINVPGGLSVYLQMFIDQFTMFRFWGALFLVAEVFATAWLTDRLVRKMTGGNIFVSMLTFILPVAVAVVAWTDVKYPFAVNMQALFLVAVMNAYLALDRFSWQKYIAPLFALLVYHACGAAALYTFAVFCIIGYIRNRDSSHLVSAIGAVTVSAFWPLLVYRYLLPINFAAALYDVRPQEQMFTSFDLSPVLYLLLAYVLVMIFVAKAYGLIQQENKLRNITIVAIAAVVVCAVVAQKKRDNPSERMGFQMGVAAYNKDWKQIIDYVRKNEWVRQSANYTQHVNFYYNMALAAKGFMGDRMFSYPQRLGINGLFINEPMATISCLPMTILFHQAGLATNALHYAFEAQSTYTSSHYVMRYVVDEMLIVGDYQNASKYLGKYSHVMFSKKFVEDRKKFIAGGSGTEFARSGYDVIKSKHPMGDFYMNNSQYDMLRIVTNDKDNMFAAQYLIASALLQNDLEMFMKLILGGYCKVNYNNLPRAYQEAVVLYRALNKEVLPGTEKPYVQSYVLEQFKSFQQVVSGQGDDVRSIVDAKFADTYWRYYFFINPKVTGVSIK